MFVNEFTHLAGVTSLYKSPKNDDQILSGSYDEHFRLFDWRNLNVPLSTLKVSLLKKLTFFPGKWWCLGSKPYWK
jgi:WD40 repeat protein